MKENELLYESSSFRNILNFDRSIVRSLKKNIISKFGRIILEYDTL